MKNIFTLLIFSCLMVFSGFAQSGGRITVGSPEYQAAKLNGTLDQYELLLDLGSSMQNGVSTPVAPVHQYNSNKSRDLDCNCYEEPDDTYIFPSRLRGCDDCSSGIINLPFTFNFYGTPYNALYINSNGNVTFTGEMTTYSSTALAGPYAAAIAAPFWADVDVRGAGQIVYKIYNNAIFINWHNVGYFPSMSDKINNFQLILTDGSHPAVPNGNNIAFCYGDMQWTAGSASGGSNGFGGTAATAGLNKGGMTQSFFQLARFDHAGTDFDGALGQPDGISWLDNKSFFFDVTNSANVPPIPQGVSPCDTFRVCALGDSAAFNIMFFAPEANQNTTISWDNGGLEALREVMNEPGLNGNSAQLIMSIVGTPETVGTYTITVTARDNYIDTGVTTLSFTIIVAEDLTNSLNPEFDVDISCGQAVVSVLNGPYDSYLWNDGAMGQTHTFTLSDTINVTVSREKCYKMIGLDLRIPQPVSPLFEGVVGLCPGEDSTLVRLSNFDVMSSINWGPGNTEYNNTDSAYLRPGTHNVVVVDTSGLCTRTTPIVITQAVASTFGNFPQLICFNDILTNSNRVLQYTVAGASVGTGAQWSSPNPELTFNGAATSTANNPTIVATRPGIYTVRLSSACTDPYEGTITFSGSPVIEFGDTTVCGRTFEVPQGTVRTATNLGGIWSNIDPQGILYTPSVRDIDPFVNITDSYPLPYELIIRINDSICGSSFNDQVRVKFVQSGVAQIPEVACLLNSWELEAESYEGGFWTVYDNPSTPWKEDTAYVFTEGDSVLIPHMVVSTAGEYRVSYYDEFCDVTTEGVINFPPYLWTELVDTMLCEGAVFTLFAPSPNDVVSYLWNTGATSESIEVYQPGAYIVTISNECYSFTDTSFVSVRKCDIESPNVISLSSQVGNNVWIVDEVGIETFECYIVNRWGNIVAVLNDVNSSWNGKDLSGNVVSEGVYFYNIKAMAYGGIEVNKQGFITVVK